MEGSGSDPVVLIPAAVRSHWNASRVHLGWFGFCCPKGLPCSISGPALHCKLRPKVRWPAVLCQKKISKLVSPLWCEKPGELGDFKSKKILGFWASYMKSCGLRNAVWYLVTPCWLGSSDTVCGSSCTQGAQPQLGQGNPTIHLVQYHGTRIKAPFIKTCLVCHATQLCWWYC